MIGPPRSRVVGKGEKHNVNFLRGVSSSQAGHSEVQPVIRPKNLKKTVESKIDGPPKLCIPGRSAPFSFRLMTQDLKKGERSAGCGFHQSGSASWSDMDHDGGKGPQSNHSLWDKPMQLL
ncbi:hypothetical protein N7513_012480 [Penicillium frequentans]|nr:hypothetical protein N7513_012480 [Penicillium glabrum]